MTDPNFMRQALRLARRGYGRTSPNPMVGAVVVNAGKILGRGWHHRAGEPHAEIEALRDAAKHGHPLRQTTQQKRGIHFAAALRQQTRHPALAKVF